MKTRLIYSSAIVVSTIILGLLTISITAAEVRVPADFTTIQAAVDAATSGDTIHIAPGVYVEQVAIINKNVFLLGQPGTILRAFPNMVNSTGADDLTVAPVIMIRNSSETVLENLTLEGDQLASQQPVDHDFQGVLYLDSGGTVRNCRFTGFREAGNSSGNNRFAVSVAVWNDLPGAPLYDMNVIGNTITDTKDGIFLIGAPDKLSLNVLVENNTIHGMGPTAATDGDGGIDGLKIINGASGSVVGNIITGFSFDGTGASFPWYRGVLVHNRNYPNFEPMYPMRFENNTFKDNDIHLLPAKADQHVIRNNTFEGTGTGQRQAGLFFTGENVLVEGNRFVNMPDAIVAVGEDPQLGTNVGVAANAQLINNVFCDVVNSVIIQPTASVSEEGSLICPFPEPELTVETAVRISWPGYYGEYIVETASSPEGPWSESTVKANMVDGQLVAFIPAADSQKYFRLRQ